MSIVSGGISSDEDRVRGARVRFGLILGFVASVCLVLGGTAQAAFLDFRATIEQAQETPPTGSTSVWTGTFQLDTATAMVSFNITQTGPPLGSPELFSHVHRGAIGVAGPIEFFLPNGNPKVGVYGPLSAAQMDEMRFGLHYANIHSNAFPAGEVRGQILPTGLPRIEHFQCYKIKKDYDFLGVLGVNVVDSFSNQFLDLKKPFLWCNPGNKNGEGINNDLDHLLCYKTKGGTALDPQPNFTTANQFGTAQLFAKKPFLFCVPSLKPTLIP